MKYQLQVAQVPSRLNYIHWLEDLLIEACGTACATQNAHGKHVKVIDIGVGSSAIYPLIGTSVAGWKFVGTDIDAASLESAQANVGAEHVFLRPMPQQSHRSMQTSLRSKFVWCTSSKGSS